LGGRRQPIWVLNRDHNATAFDRLTDRLLDPLRWRFECIGRAASGDSRAPGGGLPASNFPDRHASYGFRVSRILLLLSRMVTFLSFKMTTLKCLRSLRGTWIATAIVVLAMVALVMQRIHEEKERASLAIIRNDINSLLKNNEIIRQIDPWCSGFLLASYNNVTFSVYTCSVDHHGCINSMARLRHDLKKKLESKALEGETEELIDWLWDRLAESSHCGRLEVLRNRPLFLRCRGKQRVRGNKGVRNQRGQEPWEPKRGRS
jgi:hypothetical protein